MYLMIDNYDSFTAMLASYFAELGADMVVKKNDEISLEGIEQMDAQSALDGIVISPGPIAGIASKSFVGQSSDACRF